VKNLTILQSKRHRFGVGPALPIVAGAFLFAEAAGLRAETSAPAGSPAPAVPLQRDKVLKDPGVFGVIASFKVRPQYSQLKPAELQAAPVEMKRLVDRHQARVLVDAYLSRGLNAATDFFFRLDSYELVYAQDFLRDFHKTTLGKYADVVHTFVGVTKPLIYISKDKSPALNSGLTSATYSAPTPRYAIVIPTRKSGDWWNLSAAERQKAMEVHTEPTLPFLKNVRRKLYHSTGLDDADFITYFETDDLVAFHKLNLSLVAIPENKYNVRLGNPTLLGTIHDVEYVVRAVSE